MTSLAFILVCVPDPVCHTRKGKCSFNEPEITSSHAVEIKAPTFGSNSPNSTFVSAAAFFRIPNARIIA